MLADVNWQCPTHQNDKVSWVCLNKSCSACRVFCPQCQTQHKVHEKLAFTEFITKYEQIRGFSSIGTSMFETTFNKIKNDITKLMDIIKKSEEYATRELFCKLSFSVLPDIKQIQVQQFYGLVPELVMHPVFGSMGEDKNMDGMELKKMEQILKQFEEEIEKLSQRAVLLIRNLFTRTLERNQKLETYFNFCQKYKPKFFQISYDGTVITRKQNQFDGLTYYAVVDRPFTKKYNKINLSIIKQGKRFIYIGVCDPQTFVKNNFQGSLYEKGNKMYAIRQSKKEKTNAISLHNSLQKYSNKGIVPWDFQFGDIIGMEYRQNNNSLYFTKNCQDGFEMPLDREIKKFYPFVGIKWLNTAVKIVSMEHVSQLAKGEKHFSFLKIE